ncbi:Cytokinin dehydrogenase [Actinidia chinensis var. chinensis]|uniref:cytokinin dehydrogenase n=1 Tax=Actinidia chinensis var. chinensis TaxID=1590841 RepID=A0A2R6Q529_ACTCC|nr:Cytokinin dehydrogenase [Actinidia chinensis var. chinensis]
MAKGLLILPTPPSHVVLFIISFLMSIIGKSSSPWTISLPHELLTLDTSNRLRVDTKSIELASRDFGKIVQEYPLAVLHPSSANDIATLVKFSYNSHVPFSISARGRGHSVRGQAMAKNGVVVEMTCLTSYSEESGIRVFRNPNEIGFSYADVGGGQFWIDVLVATLEHGLAPVSWTDYLYLTVGGTLSNAGISGQSFRYGPQISNVHEMDVVTGKGELVTCSKYTNPDLFYAVLGGLGQFGIITRARIALDKAPNRVKWVRMLYHDFSSFTRDQEHLISIHGLDYVEGSLIMHQSPPNNWRSSFFSLSDQSKINSLVSKHGLIYCLEVVKYYDDLTMNTVDEELRVLIKGLSFLHGFIFVKDESFIDFLNRVRNGERQLEAQGLWDVPHPWLNLFVPKSGIMDFNAGVFIDIIQKQNKTTGPVLVYPLNKNKWDDRMSVVTPDEYTFYSIGLLLSSGDDDWEVLENQNKEIMKFCDKVGIKAKQYLPHYRTKKEWMNHFGSKWDMFRERKAMFDPKMILSPGQRIFNSVLKM